MGVGVRVTVMVTALVLGSVPACSFTSPDAACAAEAMRRIDLRFLVLGTNPEAPALHAWQAALRKEGVPFDVIFPAEEPLSRQILVPQPGHGRYQAVIHTTDDGPVQLAPAEQAGLDAYEDEFGVREVVAFGAVPATAPGPLQDLDGLRLHVTDTGRQWFPAVTGEIAVAGAFGYLSPPGRSATTLVTDADGNAVVAEQRVGDHDELFVAVQTAPERLHFQLLSHGLIQWASQGIHLGLSRYFLAVQVDDVLLPNYRWDMDRDETVVDDEDAIRMTPDDVERAVDWSQLRDFRLDLAVNNGAAGSHELCGQLRENREAFGWINHTYTHVDLDEAAGDVIDDQIRRNVESSEDNGIPFDSPQELVTGEHSGLENPALIPALEKNGIEYVAADASRTPELSRLGPALAVPRHAVNIYYDVGTKEEQLDEYNYTYFEACTGDYCLPAPLIWDQYVEAMTTEIMRLMTNNDPRTIFVHQSNLAEDAILLLVLDDVLATFRSVIDDPLVQPTLSESGDALLRQQDWDAAVRGQVFDAYIEGESIVLRAEQQLLVPVTGVGSEKYGQERSGWITLPPGDPTVLPIVR